MCMQWSEEKEKLGEKEVSKWKRGLRKKDGDVTLAGVTCGLVFSMTSAMIRCAVPIR
jgi:hypothetical protein